MKIGQSLFRGALVAAALMAAAPAFAQTAAANAASSEPHGFWITTLTPEFTAAAGKKITVPLTVINDTDAPKRAALQLSGVPKDWDYSITGGGHDVSAAMVGPGKNGHLTLEMTPPKDAKSETYKLDLKASYDSGSADLPLAVTLANVETPGATLKPELPGLRGGVKSKFDYKMTITNDGSEDQLFNLAADTPPGFQTTFKKGYGSDEITGLPVKAGGSENITMEVKLDSSVSAGKYPIHVTASAGEQSATADLSLEVTGSPDLALDAPQGRLSGTAVAGEGKTFPFTLVNTGSAPARDVKFNSKAPSGWTVSFDPAQVQQLAPDTQQDVTVTIKPTSQAIAGDYMVGLHADAAGTNGDSQFRVTVETSTMWGIVGLIVIAVALSVLALAVMRYGRR